MSLSSSSSSSSDEEYYKLMFSSTDEEDELIINAVVTAVKLIISHAQQSLSTTTRRALINPANNREPELPEVEAARRAVAETCTGKKIKRCVVADAADVIDGVSRSEFEESLTGKTIVSAHRKGKNMWIQLDSPPFPSFQFGMAGAICIKGVAVTMYKRSAVKDTDEWPSKYSKLFIELDNGLELSFTDRSRSAKVRLLENPATVAPISELGLDAFMEPMTEDELFEALSKKNIAIKTLLLDQASRQSFISGVGDWIADEVLYQAKIHPLQAAASIPKEGCAALHKSLKEVIQHSVEVDADWRHFPVDWLFRYRWGKKPGKINGMTIEFINAGGMTTAYVPELQKLSGDQAAVKPPKKSSNKNTDEAESESEEITKPKGGKKTIQKRKRDTSDDDDTSDEYDNDDDTSSSQTRSDARDNEFDLNLDDNDFEELSRPSGRDKSKKRPERSSASGSGSAKGAAYTEQLNKLNTQIVEFNTIQQKRLEAKKSIRDAFEKKLSMKKNGRI